ncbi:hypothetical protein CBL_06377 [Carabus blaptoides fortunei]
MLRNYHRSNISAKHIVSAAKIVVAPLVGTVAAWCAAHDALPITWKSVLSNAPRIRLARCGITPCVLFRRNGGDERVTSSGAHTCTPYLAPSGALPILQHHIKDSLTPKV